MVAARLATHPCVPLTPSPEHSDAEMEGDQEKGEEQEVKGVRFEEVRSSRGKENRSPVERKLRSRGKSVVLPVEEEQGAGSTPRRGGRRKSVPARYRQEEDDQEVEEVFAPVGRTRRSVSAVPSPGLEVGIVIIQ